MTQFERVYPESHSPKDERDRFNVEFNKSERLLFLEAQLFIQQHKDTTAIKQLAFIGWFAISSHDKFLRYFRDTLFKNERNNKRHGLNVRTELENKFPQVSGIIGGKLSSGGKIDE